MKLIKDKKGGLFLGLVFALFFMMIGFFMLPFMKDSVSDSRTALDCTNSSISDGGKVTCLAVDLGVPYFILAILIFVGGLIGNKI
jgi:uncharacterized membrane protein